MVPRRSETPCKNVLRCFGGPPPPRRAFASRGASMRTSLAAFFRMTTLLAVALLALVAVGPPATTSPRFAFTPGFAAAARKKPPSAAMAQSRWLNYMSWHKEQLQRARNGDCEGITYAIYQQRNGFGDDIGGMMGVLKQAFRIKAVYVVDGWLAKYLHPTLGSWSYEKLLEEGALCSEEAGAKHLVVKGHVHMGSPILKVPDAQDPSMIERHLSVIRRQLISPRPDVAERISQMQEEIGIAGKLVVGLQIRTGHADRYGSPKFLGATRAESSENARIFFDCAAGLLDVLDPEVVDIERDVVFFVATDDPKVVERARQDPRIGNKVRSFGGPIVHSMQATEEERTDANAIAMLADFFTLAGSNVLFKSSTSLFGSQANQMYEHARLVYTVNDPLCGAAGHHRCGGNHALPDTVDVWQAERESFRVKRFISFGVAPLPDTCSRSTILENVYGGRDRAPLIGTAPEDAKWPKARTLFKPTTWHEHSENETSEKTDL